VDALQLAQEHARLALLHAERLTGPPERLFVVHDAQRLVAALDYFSRVQARHAHLEASR
jgi:hypothetical protein